MIETHTDKIIMAAVAASSVVVLAAALWLGAKQKTSGTLRVAPKAEISGGMAIPGTFYVYREQSKKSHRTTIWVLGAVFLAFELTLTISWDNR